MGSLRKLFGSSSRASFDESALSSSGQGDDRTSVKSGRASSDARAGPIASSSEQNDGDTGATPAPAPAPTTTDPANPTDSQPPGTTPAISPREHELEQSLTAVQLELHRLQDRVRLLSEENDGYKKEVFKKHKELEERETVVLELKQDVEIEREKVKVMAVMGTGGQSDEALAPAPDAVAGVVPDGSGGLEEVVDEDEKLTHEAEVAQKDATQEVELSGSYATVSSFGPALVPLPTKVMVDVGTNMEHEAEPVPEPDDEELELDEPIAPELLALKETLDQQTKSLADLTSMNDSNSTINQRLAKFNDLRSHLVLLVDQTNVEAARLHKELDRSTSLGLVLLYSLMLWVLIGLLFKYAYELEWVRYVPLEYREYVESFLL